MFFKCKYQLTILKSLSYKIFSRLIILSIKKGNTLAFIETKKNCFARLPFGKEKDINKQIIKDNVKTE